MELVLYKDSHKKRDHVVLIKYLYQDTHVFTSVTHVEYIKEINHLFLYGPNNKKIQEIDLNEVQKLSLDLNCITLGLEELKDLSATVTEQ